jgi:hypothetical protein
LSCGFLLFTSIDSSSSSFLPKEEEEEEEEREELGPRSSKNIILSRYGRSNALKHARKA